MNEMYRQGDLLLIQREELSNEAIKTNSQILLEVTATGHHHKIINGLIFRQEISNEGVFAYVKANKECSLIHEEHHTINLPEGIYEVRRQREVSGYVTD